MTRPSNYSFGIYINTSRLTDDEIIHRVPGSGEVPTGLVWSFSAIFQVSGSVAQYLDSCLPAVRWSRYGHLITEGESYGFASLVMGNSKVSGPQIRPAHDITSFVYKAQGHRFNPLTKRSSLSLSAKDINFDQDGLPEIVDLYPYYPILPSSRGIG
jgi:hypothetical protein